MGHYERFMDEDLSELASLTSGKVFWSVLSRERSGAIWAGRCRSSRTIGEIKALSTGPRTGAGPRC